MPMSDDFAAEIIRLQFALIDNLRAENSHLLEILLHKELPTETKIEIPETMRSMGKVPWYKRKAALEQAATKKHKLFDITGIKEEENAS